MASRRTAGLKNNSADGMAAVLNSGLLKFYSGSVPSSVGDVPAGTLLATATLPNPAFIAASAGVAVAHTITPVSAGASGTAGCWTLSTSGGTIVGDGTVTATGNGGDITFDVIVWLAGGTVIPTGFTMTEA